jgi:signal transduction histidine kinase/ActR/RegA family two-component response regulator
MENKRSVNPNKVLELQAGITPGSGEVLQNLMRMVEYGEEPRRLFTAIVEAAAQATGSESAAIFLPSDKSTPQSELVAMHGDFTIEPSRAEELNFSERIAPSALPTNFRKTSSGKYHYFDIICMGAPIGLLAIISEKEPGPAACGLLGILAHHAGVVFERQKLSNTLQHFVDRLQVLNELNQLIASSVGLQRIVKSVARESAFRFGADVAMTALFDEDKNHLEVRGGYGCAPHLIPKKLDGHSGILGQVMRCGGHISVANLKGHLEHGLGFIEQVGIKSVDLCCLEVKGEALGAILIGYRRETIISQNDLTRFEEFCQGAAVAIANARTQERITAYTERLEELVEQRTADLAIQTARAEEANRAKSQFLANMSHELRTPLTAIVGYASVLSDGIFGPLNEKQTDALNAVVRSSEHLKNLINDVLNLARIESGKEEANPSKVSLKDSLTQIHKLMLQSSISKGVSLLPLKLTEDVAAATLWVDSKHIHQIIINMMSNAVKYTPKGGQVKVAVELLGDKARISITDTGVGIPPAKLEVLFERFERGEDTYSKSQEGTGIGLNLTKQLVELNGGVIGVESTVGVGTTFWILVPLTTSEHVVVSQPETFDTNIRLDGLTTLLVDDNLDTCEVLKQVLMNAGAGVRTAHSAKDGMALLEEGLPDILLTDLAMPGESGLVFMDKIRKSSGPMSELPIIVLSACAFQSDIDAALNAGASMFIAKPFKPYEILKYVRQLTLNSALNS